jgi:hypothetical protein
MGISRSVEWKLNCSADKADALVRQAMNALGMECQGPPGTIRGEAKRSLLKNRWAAKVEADVTPAHDGSVVVCRVDMLGTKHYALLADIAEAMGDEVFDDRGVAAAIERLGRTSRLFGHKEIRHLRNLLQGSEHVVALGQGEYEGKQGLVVLTTVRLFFFEKSLGSETLEEFSLSSISSIAVNKKVTGEQLVIHASGNNAEIKHMMHGEADAVARSFRSLKAKPETQGVTQSTPQAVRDDPLQQIERLAGMRDRGLISPEEFEAKKTELMGRL